MSSLAKFGIVFAAILAGSALTAPTVTFGQPGDEADSVAEPPSEEPDGPTATTGSGTGAPAPSHDEPAPVPLPEFPEKPDLTLAAFPDCFENLPTNGPMSSRLTAMRFCRQSIEIYRDDKIEGFNIRLKDYDSRLGNFDARYRSPPPHPRYAEIAKFVRAEQDKLATQTGSYYEPYRSAMINYRQKMSFLCDEIRSIKRSERC